MRASSMPARGARSKRAWPCPMRRAWSTPATGESCGFSSNLDRTTTLYIKRGERIAQLVVQPVVEAEIEFVSKLDPSERGEAGFGSTGR